MNRPAPEMVAILRGLEPARAQEVGAVLVEAGFRTIEVPLNSPEPLRCIELLARAHGAKCCIGAGTVLAAGDVDKVRDAGGRLVVAPNCNEAVIQKALALGLRVLPGIATATEALVALSAGATDLKLFPAATFGPGHLRALKSVLPATVRMYAVGGIGADDIGAWMEAGADGFGFGGELFRPAYALEEIRLRARRLVGTVERDQPR